MSSMSQLLFQMEYTKESVNVSACQYDDHPYQSWLQEPSPQIEDQAGYFIDRDQIQALCDNQADRESQHIAFYAKRRNQKTNGGDSQD